MAFTEAEEMALKRIANREPNINKAVYALENSVAISGLPLATDAEIAQSHVEVETASGVSKRLNFYHAVHARQIACRRWNETLSTPTGEAWGDIDFLRNLPSTLGLGCYLVQDDGSARKLDPTNHYRFADGTLAALDGSMGQYQWRWEEHNYCTRREGSYLYEAVALKPIDGWECYRIPAGCVSALGAGVLDRTNLKLCSVINTDAQYRGGGNQSAWDGTYRDQRGMPATNVAYTNFSAYARKRGVGWEANWYVARAVVEYLFRIIMGTRNSQAPVSASKDSNGLFQGGLGNGVTNVNSAAWAAYNSYYPLVPCSAGVELADGVGEAPFAIKNEDGSTMAEVKVPVFFGLKNIFGNIRQVVRGIIVDAGEERTRTYVAPSLYNNYNNGSLDGLLFASEQPRVGGWIKKVSMYRLNCVATEIGGAAGTYYGDQFYTSVDSGAFGLRARLAGGNARESSFAGASYAHVAHAVAGSGTYVSAPLCFFAEDPVMV